MCEKKKRKRFIDDLKLYQSLSSTEKLENWIPWVFCFEVKSISRRIFQERNPLITNWQNIWVSYFLLSSRFPYPYHSSSFFSLQAIKLWLMEEQIEHICLQTNHQLTRKQYTKYLTWLWYFYFFSFIKKNYPIVLHCFFVFPVNWWDLTEPNFLSFNSWRSSVLFIEWYFSLVLN